MNFVSIAPDYWDGPRYNRQYFCEELSRKHSVFFVSPPFYVGRLLSEFGRGTLPPSGVREVSPGLVSYTPSKFLFTNFRLPALNDWMRKKRMDELRRTMRRRGIDKPVLIIWHPEFRDMVGQFDESLVIYYIYDQYTGYTGGGGTRSEAEVDLMKRADLTFVVSRELYENKRNDARQVVHLANAVDFNLFSTARDERTVVPADMASIPGRRLGYVGTINEKVDLDILEKLAARPEWSIVLIGRENYSVPAEKERFYQFTQRPNVHWLGYRSHDVVPSYLKGMDVCMMCYVINNWTFYGDPSKLHEYLASGKPTIGTGLQSVKEFSEVVAIPANPDEWVTAVDAALAETGPEPTLRRIEVARQNSYSARVDRFLEIVQSALDKR